MRQFSFMQEGSSISPESPTGVGNDFGVVMIQQPGDGRETPTYLTEVWRRIFVATQIRKGPRDIPDESWGREEEGEESRDKMRTKRKSFKRV